MPPRSAILLKRAAALGAPSRERRGRKPSGEHPLADFAPAITHLIKAGHSTSAIADWITTENKQPADKSAWWQAWRYARTLRKARSEKSP